MMNDNQVKINITADGFDMVGRKFSELSGRLDKFAQHTQAMGHFSVALAGMGYAASVLGTQFKGVIDAADSMNDLAQRTGISIQALAKWRLAADQSGTSIESVARGVKGLASYMVDHADKLRAAGITAADADGAMMQLADLFKAMPDSVEKTTLAVQLFGKSGMDMIPMLNMGSAGLKDAAEQAALYAQRLQELAPKADEFNDKLAELTLQYEAAKMNGLLPYIDGLIGLIEFTKDASTGSAGLGKALGVLGDTAKISFGAIYTGADTAYTALLQLSRFTVGDYSGIVAAGNAWSKRQTEYWSETQTPDPKRSASGKITRDGMVTEDADKNRRLAWANAETQRRYQSLFDKPVRAGAKAAKSGQPISDAEQLRLMNRTSDWREELRAQTMATNEVIEANAKLAEKYKALADPLEKYRDELAEINKLRAAGNLTAEEAYQAEQRVMAGMEDARLSMEGFKESGENTFADLTAAVEGWGNAFTDSMADMVMNGKLNFSSLAESIIRDLIRMQIQANITKPLLGMASGFLDGLLGGGLGSQPYTGGVDAVNGSDLASDWASSGNSGVIFSEIRHAGGIAGGAATMAGRYIHPAAFADAPRFHTGGIAADEVPIIARKGEGIFTEAQMAALSPVGGSNVVVNVIEAPGQGGKTQDRQEGNTRIIDVWVEQIKTAVAGDIARGNGPVGGAIERTYGLNRSAGAY
jgi:lambda family phage tail tape measure protein